MSDKPDPLSFRREDRRFLKGAGRFTDDLPHPDALHVAFLRASIASGRIVDMDVDAARQAAGVRAVFTAKDLRDDGIAPFIGPIKVEGPGGETYTQTPLTLLTEDTVHHAGEPLAMVIAETLAQALDAVERIEVSISETPAVIGMGQTSGPLVWPNRPDNIAFRWGRGDHGAVKQALSRAHHVVTFKADVSRVYAAAIEPRCALAYPETPDRTVIYASHQSPHALARSISSALALAPDAVRVVAGDVGGSFGMKSGFKREETLVFWAARRLGKALRWTATRAEGLLSDEHGRDVAIEVQLGLEADGKFSALQVQMDANIGAYFSLRSMPPVRNFGGISGMYDFPVVAGGVTAWFSNAAPTASYRGAGRPEATFAIECAIDHAARQIGMDPVALRQRNLIPPDAMPFQTGFLYTYDCGDFPKVMQRALVLADYAGFPARQAKAAARGMLRGIGVANAVEIAAGPLAKPATDFAELIAHPNGIMTLYAGAMSTGQGLETSLTKLAGSCLGLDAGIIRYVQGDTSCVTKGRGSGGSSGLTLCGSSVQAAALALIEKGRDLAALSLNGAKEDIVYAQGVFHLSGSGRSITVAALEQASEARGVPLSAQAQFQMPAPTYPNGCHLCELEIDPDTGATTVIAYTSVEDIGTVLNPELVEGQIHGGVAQGIGQALMEQINYDDTGQILSGSFMDYAMPRAADLCSITSDCVEVPTLVNPLGVKGVGEAGTVGALSATMNAVLNALAPLGVTRLDMPASPSRIWAAIQAARQAGKA